MYSETLTIFIETLIKFSETLMIFREMLIMFSETLTIQPAVELL